MAEAGIMNLSLKIAGDDYDDFYPYELSLEEGFSKVYRAELTVFTKNRREQKDMRKLLERKASLVVSQRLTGGQITRHRYVHGIITGTTSLGIVSRGEDGNKGAACFRHVITIESELSHLRHTSLNCPYYRKTPPDIIEEIFSRYGIRAEFPDKYINRSNFSKNVMFEQTDISDIDFIHRIMDMYGLSWTFAHGKVSQSGLGTAELFFSEGSRFPPPWYDYSDKRKIPEIERFDFMNYDERQNVWKMDRFSMESGIGVDGLEVTAPYPQENHGSREWRWGSIGPGKRYHSYKSLFHGYERGTPPEGIDADMQRMLEARRIAHTIAKENLDGAAENIALMPGLIFELKHFLGPSSDAALTALVTDSRLHVRAMWPRDLAAPPAGEEPGELARVEFSAKDWGMDSENRFCRIERHGGSR